MATNAEKNQIIMNVLKEFRTIKDAFEQRYTELYSMLAHMSDETVYGPAKLAEHLLDQAMWNNVDDEAQIRLDTFMDAIEAFPMKISFWMEPYIDCFVLRCVFANEKPVNVYISDNLRISIITAARANGIHIEGEFDESMNMMRFTVFMEYFDRFAEWIIDYIN